MSNLRGDRLSIDTLLVPTDGSASSERSVAIAALLAQALHAHIHILFVCEFQHESPWYYFAFNKELASKLRKKGAMIANQAARHAKGKTVKSVTVHVLDGHPAEVIPKLAEDLEADMIVMGSRGRRGLERVLMGSVAREVANTSPVPVLLVK